MTRSGPSHPLDVDLADFVDGTLDAGLAVRLEAHLADCLLCRIKRKRLRAAPPAAPAPVPESPPPVTFAVPPLERPEAPSVGELWLAGSGQRILVLILRTERGRALVAPVTFDAEAADDESIVVDAGHSPLGVALAVHPSLAAEIPSAVLAGRLGMFTSTLDEGPGVTRGTPIESRDDPRLESRQLLADQLGALEDAPLDVVASMDAPPVPVEHFRSSLIRRLRDLRGASCMVRPFDGWDDLLAAEGAGWEPIVTIDEVGIVMVAFDTPHGLADDVDYDVARSVLTRLNATALVVLARALGDSADVFDAASLNYGIEMPSGAHTPPRPLISGLSPLDAINKFLDQHTGARLAHAPSRGPVTRVDVGAILREAATTAAADTVRQGARFKITPKRRGYESLADADEALVAALSRAFGDESVVEGLIDLARRKRS